MASPIIRQQYNKEPFKVTKSTTSRGDGSGLFNVSETAYGNGNISIVSDLVTKDIVQTDYANIVNANNISEVQGNNSKWVNEVDESVSNSKYVIVGNISNMRHGFYKEADNAQQKLVAMRTGFNDDRHESQLIPDLGLGEFPSELLNKIMVVDKKTALGDDAPKIPSLGGGIFMDIATIVANEVAQLTTTMSKISVKSALKQAELVAKNKVEKTQKTIESALELPECPTKEKFKEAIASGNLSVLFSSPSNEEKEKNSVFDRDAYEAEAVEAANKLLNVEREFA